ncbi:MAG: hypothetical protein HOB67_08845 [Acidimicrobiaceae bacterium]|jgi:hypothetical protein|nr:hypothetical protein [Acidimicrobiaceae bacterium]
MIPLLFMVFGVPTFAACGGSAPGDRPSAAVATTIVFTPTVEPTTGGAVGGLVFDQ